MGDSSSSDGVMMVTGGLYAPTIRHNKGTTYVICTNILHDGGDDEPRNFIVSTGDIWSGEWSDPVYFDFRGIDPNLFFDDDGKVYVQGSAAPGPMTKIHNFEIDVATGAKLSEERLIWEGTGGIYPEGPHVYKRGGWYFLMISEGGTHEGHMITMARSRDIWGPYEPCPHNPILTARGTAEYIRYTGHCDAFQDDDGQWWGVCLGVRKDPGGRFIMGRETFLARGNWDGEWLTFELVKSHPAGLSRPEGKPALESAPMVDLVYIRDADLSRYSFTGGGTAATLAATSTDLSAPEDSPTFVGKRQRLLGGSTKATVTGLGGGPAAAGARAGVAVYKDEHRWARIFYDGRDGSVVFELVNKGKEIRRTERAQLGVAPETLGLRIGYTEQEYSFHYSVGGAGEQRLAASDTLELTGPDFVGPVCGVFALVDEGKEAKVSFVDFVVD